MRLTDKPESRCTARDRRIRAERILKASLLAIVRSPIRLVIGATPWRGGSCAEAVGEHGFAADHALPERRPSAHKAAGNKHRPASRSG